MNLPNCVDLLSKKPLITSLLLRLGEDYKYVSYYLSYLSSHLGVGQKGRACAEILAPPPTTQSRLKILYVAKSNFIMELLTEFFSFKPALFRILRYTHARPKFLNVNSFFIKSNILY